MWMGIRSWAGLGLLTLVACGGGPPAAAPPAVSGGDADRVRRSGLDPARPRGQALALQMREIDAARRELRRSLAVPKPQILALSGGGQWGAFGAGFLKGWTKRGDRPKAFEVVTGTSTGSLIAPFAFLGAEYDDAVGRAYLDIRGDGDILDKRFLLTALFSDALATTKPLRRLVEKHVSASMVAKVGQEAQKGRRLFVGAVDLDLGIFKPFDLTEIASRGGPSAHRDFVDALMASTAIPVAFPPVTIAGRTYVDGGVRRNIFLELLADEARRLRAERALAVPSEPTVHCLVNGRLDVGAFPVKRRVLDIAKRSVDLLLDESTDGNLLRIYLQAQKAGILFRMTRVPAGMCDIESTGEHQFDPAVMACLHEQAQAFALLEEAWSTEPPLAPFVP